MEFLTKHFLAISTGLTVWAGALVLAVMVSFLATFNPSLIFLIEYQDVLRFSFIIFSFIIGLSLFLNYQFVGALQYHKEKSGGHYVFALGISIALVLLFIAISYFEGSNSLHSHEMAAVLLLLGYVGLLVEAAVALPDLNPYWAVTKLFLLPLGACAYWGFTLAEAISADPSRVVDVDIGTTSKNPDTLFGVKLIMMLSNNAIFQDKYGKIIVIQRGDITKLTMDAAKAR